MSVFLKGKIVKITIPREKYRLILAKSLKNACEGVHFIVKLLTGCLQLYQK